MRVKTALKFFPFDSFERDRPSLLFGNELPVFKSVPFIHFCFNFWLALLIHFFDLEARLQIFSFLPSVLSLVGFLPSEDMPLYDMHLYMNTIYITIE
jgi:hypothetical protein